jgi:hypothetical protein
MNTYAITRIINSMHATPAARARLEELVKERRKSLAGYVFNPQFAPTHEKDYAKLLDRKISALSDLLNAQPIRKKTAGIKRCNALKLAFS